CDRPGGARDVPRGVGVVDPQQQRPTVLVGEAAVRDGRQRAAQVQRPGRARCEADTDHQRATQRYATAPPLSFLVLYGLVLGRLRALRDVGPTARAPRPGVL